jgi:YggT family protein
MNPDPSFNLIALTFIDLFVFIFNILLISRVLMSYIVDPLNSLFINLVSLTEPVLMPVRKVLPQTHGVDFAPLVTFFLLQGVQIMAHNLLGA